MRTIAALAVGVTLALGACGDPTTESEPQPDVVGGASPAPCSPPPFASGPSASPGLGDSEAATALVDAHPDVFAGVWWDGQAQQVVFAAADADAADALLKKAGLSSPTRVDTVARAAVQLAELQGRAEELVARGVEVSSSTRVWDATVELMVPILDEATIAAIRQVYGEALDGVCLSGADPAALPDQGPQQGQGDGWRLLADEVGVGDPYDVSVATDPAGFDAQWAELGVEGSPPPVDFTNEVVVRFVAAYSGSCPEIRFDGVRVTGTLVEPDIVTLGGMRECTADANPRTYLVALDRSTLPSPTATFTVLGDPCVSCEQVTLTLD